jgi:hypothetical protein
VFVQAGSIGGSVREWLKSVNTGQGCVLHRLRPLLAHLTGLSFVEIKGFVIGTANSSLAICADFLMDIEAHSAIGHLRGHDQVNLSNSNERIEPLFRK